MARRIPDDLLEDIGKRLSTKTDVSRFRAVCKSWRSLIPPWEKQRVQFPVKVRWWDDITESVVYHLAPPGDDPCERGWLMKVKEGRRGKTRMIYPLSHLTAYWCRESFPKVLNLLDYRVCQVSRTYEILYHFKVVVSSELDNFPVFMLIWNTTLYYGKFGFEDEKSIQVRKLEGDFNDMLHFEDVIFHEGKFYAVTMDGEIVVLDSCLIGTVFEPKLVSSRSHLFSSTMKVSRKLVESGGDLLLVDGYSLVDRYSSKKTTMRYTEFRVYKLSADNREWRELEDEALSDRILILGDDCCYSICSRDFPGYTGNIIYFSTFGDRDRHSKWSHDLKDLCSGIGVFCLRNNRCWTLRACASFENIFYPSKTHLSH